MWALLRGMKENLFQYKKSDVKEISLSEVNYLRLGIVTSSIHHWL